MSQEPAQHACSRQDPPAQGGSAGPWAQRAEPPTTSTTDTGTWHHGSPRSLGSDLGTGADETGRPDIRAAERLPFAARATLESSSRGTAAETLLVGRAPPCSWRGGVQMTPGKQSPERAPLEIPLKHSKQNTTRTLTCTHVHSRARMYTHTFTHAHENSSHVLMHPHMHSHTYTHAHTLSFVHTHKHTLPGTHRAGHDAVTSRLLSKAPGLLRPAGVAVAKEVPITEPTSPVPAGSLLSSVCSKHQASDGRQQFGVSAQVWGTV